MVRSGGETSWAFGVHTIPVQPVFICEPPGVLEQVHELPGTGELKYSLPNYVE